MTPTQHISPAPQHLHDTLYNEILYLLYINYLFILSLIIYEKYIVKISYLFHKLFPYILVTI